MLTVKSILMICQGNICRSPMAEGFFFHQINQFGSPIAVSSAGLTAVTRYPADPSAQEVMNDHGIDISNHRARQITTDYINQADLIFVMTRNQRNALEHQFLAAKGKTYLLGHWQHSEVEDPLRKPIEAFEKVYLQVELAWHDWKTRILPCTDV